MKANASNPHCASEAATFKKQIEAMDSLFNREIHAVKRFGLYIGVGLRTGAAEITLIAFAVFPMLAGFNVAILTYHFVSLAFLWRLAHNQTCLGPMRAIALVLIKALSVPAGRAFNSLKIQSTNYNWYITISNIICQVKSYLTYINFSNILRVWLNQKHGIGGFINASDVSMSGSPVKRRNIRTCVQSARVHIGTSHAKTQQLNRLRVKNSSADGNKFVYNIEAHGCGTFTHEATGLSPLFLWRNLDGDLELVKPDRDYHESPRVANVITQCWLPPF